ncbi:hypothetical protein ACNFIA_02570 [Pseudomonas sp. NY15437]|nr:hypothetical protein [Pseudomonas sp. GCEP-101]
MALFSFEHFSGARMPTTLVSTASTRAIQGMANAVGRTPQAGIK